MDVFAEVGEVELLGQRLRVRQPRHGRQGMEGVVLPFEADLPHLAYEMGKRMLGRRERVRPSRATGRSFCLDLSLDLPQNKRRYSNKPPRILWLREVEAVVVARNQRAALPALEGGVWDLLNADLLELVADFLQGPHGELVSQESSGSFRNDICHHEGFLRGEVFRGG
ncbi:MAG: hypothetical protein ACRYG8_10245 [Janthinobacterium lividum]